MVKRLTATEEEVLLHIARYRLTVPNILAKTDLLDSSEDEGAAETLEKLTKAKLLVASELRPELPGMLCYQLTAAGARRLGHDEAFATPLKLDARIECFAILAFCCCGSVYRQLFTKKEFQERFASIWYPGQPVRYYLEPNSDGAARLAFLKVDRDGPGRWDRLIDSCSRFLKKRTSTYVASEYRAATKTFSLLIARDRFQFSVLTATPDKRKAIETELRRRKAVSEVVPPIRAYLVEDLLNVAYPPTSHFNTCRR